MGALPSPAMLAPEVMSLWHQITSFEGRRTPAQEAEYARQHERVEAMERLILTGEAASPADALVQIMVTVGGLNYSAGAEDMEDVTAAHLRRLERSALALGQMLGVDLVALGARQHFFPASFLQEEAH